MNEILIYDDIGVDWYGDGISAKSIKDKLDRMSGDITVRINSPGGDVFEGIAIYNLLKVRGVSVVVDGLAASAASVIAMAGANIAVGCGAMLMIHNPWTMTVGDAAEMDKTASMLREVGASLADIYENRTGLARETISAMMDAETWISADEARTMGFADAITDDSASVVNVSRPWIRGDIPEPSFAFRVAARKRRMGLVDRLPAAAGFSRSQGSRPPTAPGTTVKSLKVEYMP